MCILAATVGEPWTGASTANISDDDAFDHPSSYYTASTNYNDGTGPSTSQISDSSNSGTWAVTGSHTFNTAGTYSPHTAVSDLNNIVVAAADSTASVNLALNTPLTSSSVWITEGESIGTVVTTLTDSAGAYSSGNYTGSLTLTPSGGSGQTYAVSFVPDGLNDGGYSVQASGVPALSIGTYSGLFAASESSGSQTIYASSSFVVTVLDAPLDTTSISISADMGIPWTGTVATFTDGDPNTNVSNYAATVSFGDSSAPVAGTVSSDGASGWVVTASHTFTAIASLTPLVTISDLDGGTSRAAARRPGYPVSDTARRFASAAFIDLEPHRIFRSRRANRSPPPSAPSPTPPAPTPPALTPARLLSTGLRIPSPSHPTVRTMAVMPSRRAAFRSWPSAATQQR